MEELLMIDPHAHFNTIQNPSATVQRVLNTGTRRIVAIIMDFVSGKGEIR